MSAGTQVLHLLLKEMWHARAEIEWDAFDLDPLFTYAYNVRVDGRFTAASGNAVSMISIIVTAISGLITVVLAYTSTGEPHGESQLRSEEPTVKYK
jgi:hypothetical protein